MHPRSHALSPDALVMVDAIARTGSFAAAARELGKVPSALTYSVRQLEDALDVLLFDRRSRQARLTAAGQELLDEGRRLLAEIDAVANRVRRVGSGWETRLTVAIDDIIARAPVFDLCEAFYALDPQRGSGGGSGGPGTRLRVVTEVLAGTIEALTSGQADLAIGITPLTTPPTGVASDVLGELAFVFVCAPGHPLAGLGRALDDADMLRHRAVAVADSARRLAPITVNLLPGQDVFTVASTSEKIDAIRRGLGCGWVPAPAVREALARGELVAPPTRRAGRVVPMGYAWRCVIGPRGRKVAQGLALQWWLARLEGATTRRALLGGG